MKAVIPQAVPKRNVLLYGPPKTGKTAGATSAPDPVLLLNADLPNASIFAHDTAFKMNRKLIEIAYEGFSTLMEISASLKKGDLTFGGLSDTPIETIVLDPVGELYRRLLEEFSNNAVSPSLPKYQEAAVQLERFCRFLCYSQDVNFVMTAHEHPVQDETTGEVEKLLWAGTKSNSQTMSQKLMGLVDIVGYTGVVDQSDGSREYVAQLVNAKGRRGGDRFDSLLGPGELTRPVNLAEWFTAVTEPAQPEKEKVKA